MPATGDRPAVVPVLAENIPAELRALRRWVCWRWTPKTLASGRTKWDKPPLRPDGTAVAINDARQWVSFEEAYRAHVLGDADGVGVVLPPGVTGVDLDDVRNGSGLNTTGQLLAARFRTYAEWSPSGQGVKFFCGGHLDPELPAVRAEQGVEIYEGTDTGSRYFTVTGHVLDDSHREITEQRSGIQFLQSTLADPLREVVDTPDGDSYADGEDAEAVLDALAALRPERARDRPDWLAVGMALHHVDSSEDQFQRWVEFSKRCPEKFVSEEDCRKTWRSFRVDRARGVIGAGTLLRMARRDGWKPRTEYQTRAIPVCDFVAQEIRREYVVEDFLALGEPMIIGGATKSLKTSVSLDLAVSIATGSPFLGRFLVPRPRRVVMISGESGELTTQETLRQICAAKNLDITQIRDLLVGFRLPKLDDPAHVDALVREMREREVEIAIIDPLYRSLRVGEGASNVYSMGEKLELVAEKIHRAGITPILNHHFRKQGKSYTVAPELEDLSQAGIAEFGRQFLLLKRREVYKYDGVHSLWFSWGGSAGHQGTAVLDAHTGTQRDGLKWEVRLRSPVEVQEAAEEDAELKWEMRKEALRLEIIRVFRENPTTNKTDCLRDATGKEAHLRDVFNWMQEEGEIVSVKGRTDAPPGASLVCLPSLVPVD